VRYSYVMRWVLGLDGGGTEADCVLMDESGAILARTRRRGGSGARPRPVAEFAAGVAVTIRQGANGETVS